MRGAMDCFAALAMTVLQLLPALKLNRKIALQCAPRFWWCVDLSGSPKTTPDIRYADISPAFAKATVGNLGCFARWGGNGLPTEAAKQRRLVPWPARHLRSKPLKIRRNSSLVLGHTNAYTNNWESSISSCIYEAFLVRSRSSFVAVQMRTLIVRRCYRWRRRRRLIAD